jgi:rhamnosyl/mannosyltransferase
MTSEMLAAVRPYLARAPLAALLLGISSGAPYALIGATPVHFAGSTQIPSQLDEARRFVIPYGFEPQRWSLGAAALRQLAVLKEQAAGRFAVFALGRHVYYKGFDVLIKAMRTVDGLLWIGGDGPLRASLEQLAQAEGVADRVRFVGPIAEDQLPAFYAACDVFCLPSVEKSEAFGLVQLEAMLAAQAQAQTTATETAAAILARDEQETG